MLINIHISFSHFSSLSSPKSSRRMRRNFTYCQRFKSAVRTSGNLVVDAISKKIMNKYKNLQMKIVSTTRRKYH